MSDSEHPYLGWEVAPRPFPDWGPQGDSERAAFERSCRAAARPTYVGDCTVLSTVLGNFRMFLDAQDTRIAHHLMFDGYWESWVTIGIASLLQPGMTFVDVGANHGYYSLLAADRVGSSGRVIAIEPQQRLTDLMRRTFEANSLSDRVEVHRAAVTDTVGTVTLHVPLDFGANASVGKGFDMLEERVEEVEVPCTTLDALLRDTPVDVVKIDVEGAERLVLSGMTELISRNPHLQIGMEIEGWHPGHKDLLGRLQLLGFRPSVINFSGDLHEVSYAYLRGRSFEPMVVFRRPTTGAA